MAPRTFRTAELASTERNSPGRSAHPRMIPNAAIGLCAGPRKVTAEMGSRAMILAPCWQARSCTCASCAYTGASISHRSATNWWSTLEKLIKYFALFSRQFLESIDTKRVPLFMQSHYLEFGL